MSFRLGASSPAKELDERHWTLEYRVVGGIAGRADRLLLTDDGRIIAENLARGVRGFGVASPGQIKEIEKYVSTCRLRRVPARRPSIQWPTRCTCRSPSRWTGKGTR
jgi:hypothetical protein